MTSSIIVVTEASVFVVVIVVAAATCRWVIGRPQFLYVVCCIIVMWVRLTSAASANISQTNAVTATRTLSNTYTG